MTSHPDIVPISHLIDQKLSAMRYKNSHDKLKINDMYENAKQTERRKPKFRTSTHAQNGTKTNQTADLISVTQSNKQDRAPIVLEHLNDSVMSDTAQKQPTDGGHNHFNITQKVSSSQNMNSDIKINSSTNLGLNHKKNHSKESHMKMSHLRQNSTKGPLYLENLIIIDKINGHHKRRTSRKPQGSPYDSVPGVFKKRNKYATTTINILIYRHSHFNHIKKSNFESTVKLQSSRDQHRSQVQSKYLVSIQQLNLYDFRAQVKLGENLNNLMIPIAAVNDTTAMSQCSVCPYDEQLYSCIDSDEKRKRSKIRDIKDKITQGLNKSMANLPMHKRRAIKSGINDIIVCLCYEY